MPIDRRMLLKTGLSISAGASFLPTLGLAQSNKPIVTAISNPGAQYLPYYVADKAGFGKKQGLALDSIMISSGVGVRDAVVAGRALFSEGQGNTPAQLIARGRPAKTIFSVIHGAPNANVVIRKDLFDQGINTIEKFAEWKRPDGSKPLVVATSKGSGSYILGALIFTAHGVLDKFGWVFAGGGTSQVLALLKSKQADAVIANPNWEGSAVSEGFGAQLFDILAPQNTLKVFGGPFMNTVFYTLESTLKDRQLTQSYVNALYEAMQWIKSHSEDEAWDLLKDNYFSQLDAAITKNEMAVFKRVWNYDGIVSNEVYERSRKLYQDPAYDTPDMPYEAVIDMSFAEAAKKAIG